ncbi:MAG: NADH-quinone oxidoreductase subunit J [Phycisphaeraceae bacterium]
MLTLSQHSPAPSLEQVAPLLFFAFAGLSVLSAWAIVLSQNIVRMAVYLLLTLAGVAGIYFMLDAELLAAIQLIVYAGGTLILIVFGVMLTSRNPWSQLRPAGWEMVVGLGIGFVIAALLVLALVTTPGIYGYHPPPGAATAPAGEGYGQVEMVGRALLSTYLVPFEVAAVLLLVVMIGAAYMARRRSAE